MLFLSHEGILYQASQNGCLTIKLIDMCLQFIKGFQSFFKLFSEFFLVKFVCYQWQVLSKWQYLKDRNYVNSNDASELIIFAKYLTHSEIKILHKCLKIHTCDGWMHNYFSQNSDLCTRSSCQDLVRVFQCVYVYARGISNI